MDDPVTQDAPAPRRKKKSATPWLLAMLVFGLSAIVVLAVAIIVVSNRDDGEVDRGEAITETLGYDPAANPFTLGRANALGVPLRRDAVVVLDASRSADEWLGHATAQLEGPSGLGDSHTLVVATESGPRPYQPGETLRGQGLADAAVTAASLADRSPEQVVWITAEPLAPATVDALTALGAPVSVIQIDRRDAPAEFLAEDTGGRYIELYPGQLRAWRDAAP